MKIKIEEKVEREIDVCFPMYRKGQKGWYYDAILDENTVIHIWTTEKRYTVTIQGIRPDMISETVECSKEEFDAAFSQVVENLKSMLC